MLNTLIHKKKAGISFISLDGAKREDLFEVAKSVSKGGARFVLFNPASVFSGKVLEFAVRASLLAEERKEMEVNSFDIDVLLKLSATKQVTKALEFMGLGRKRKAGVVVVSDKPESAFRLLLGKTCAAELPNANFEELRDRERIGKWYGLENVADDEMERAIIEKIALSTIEH